MVWRLYMSSSRTKGWTEEGTFALCWYSNFERQLASKEEMYLLERWWRCSNYSSRCCAIGGLRYFCDFRRLKYNQHCYLHLY
jgi:hypothetical protein